MGNKNIVGLPASIIRNWQSITSTDDVYRNKLTSECVREQVIKIEDGKKMEELRTRMKESNPYICRVVFCCRVASDECYVYTDETRNRPYVHNLEQWKTHKQNIVDAFLCLARQYGPTRVCSDMIGVDFTGQIKVWIHPNPVFNQSWYPCNSQSQMIADILALCRNIRDQSLKTKFKDSPPFQAPPTTSTLTKNLAVKSYYRTHGRQNTAQLKDHSSTKLKCDLSTRKAGQVTHIKKFVHCTSELKASNSKTKCSENSKEKQDLEVYTSFIQTVHNTSVSSWLDENQSSFDRFKTEVFETPFQKNSYRRLTFNGKDRPVNHKKRENHTSKLTTLAIRCRLEKENFTKLLEGRVEELKKLQRESACRIRQLKNTLAERRSQEEPMRKCRSIENPRVKYLREKPRLNDNLSGKLANVVYMPVKEERESELTFTELNDDRSIASPRKYRNIDGKEMTISQELVKFFDDNQRQEQKQANTKAMKKIQVQWQIGNEVRQLFQ